jgi:hypothetical protein
MAPAPPPAPSPRTIGLSTSETITANSQAPQTIEVTFIPPSLPSAAPAALSSVAPEAISSDYFSHSNSLYPKLSASKYINFSFFFC